MLRREWSASNCRKRKIGAECETHQDRAAVEVHVAASGSTVVHSMQALAAAVARSKRWKSVDERRGQKGEGSQVAQVDEGQVEPHAPLYRNHLALLFSKACQQCAHKLAQNGSGALGNGSTHQLKAAVAVQVLE